MIEFCPLASGSKGNALYLGTKKTKLLIYAGLSVKELASRLSEIGVALNDIEAVLITHEHADHIRGLAMLCKKYRIPVLANRETAKAVVAALAFVPQCKIFVTGDLFTWSDVQIRSFPIQHDAIEPVAFTFEVDQMKIGICADLGFVTTLVRNHLMQCDCLYIEANHQTSMVHACSRPLIYKQRVLSRQGHLSNTEAAELISHVHHERLQHVYLAHLSSECNVPEVALHTVQEALYLQRKKVSLSVAWQDRISHFISLGENR